jgi:IS5 family transposase
LNRPTARVAELSQQEVGSIGLVHARLHLYWKVAAYNLQRLVYLKKAGVKAF